MTHASPVLFLIGPRGTGKSTVGRALARKLGRDFCDIDALVCGQADMSVSEIVACEGWPGFRRRESQALALAAKDGYVVATGGGAVLAEENRVLMRSAGLVFFLSASPEVLYDRLCRDAADGQRPPLTDLDMKHEIAAVFAEREPIYRATAHFTLEASAPVSGIIAEILRILDRSKGSYI